MGLGKCLPGKHHFPSMKPATRCNHATLHNLPLIILLLYLLLYLANLLDTLMYNYGIRGCRVLFEKLRNAIVCAVAVVLVVGDLYWGEFVVVMDVRWRFFILRNGGGFEEEGLYSIGDQVLWVEHVVYFLSSRQSLLVDKVLIVVDRDKQPQGASE